MQRAISADQGIVTDFPAGEEPVVEYPDNLQDEIQEAVEVNTAEEEVEARILQLIQGAKDSKDLEKRVKSFPPDMKEKFRDAIADKYDSFDQPQS
jgi:hypothetical protein